MPRSVSTNVSTMLVLNRCLTLTDRFDETVGTYEGTQIPRSTVFTPSSEDTLVPVTREKTPYAIRL